MASRTPLGALKQSVQAPRLARAQSSTTTSSFFPTQSFSQPRQQLPPNSLWFTARPSLNATLQSLQTTLTASRAHLFKAGLLPSINSSLGVDAEFSSTLPHPRARRWMATKEMATYLRNGTDLKSSQYKKLTSVLSNLEGLLPYAELADQLPSPSSPSLVVDPVAASKGALEGQDAFRGDSVSLRAQLEDILARFQQPQAVSSTGIAVDRVVGKDRRLGKKDKEGRVMAVGRRKESGARVWIIPAQGAADAAEQIPGRVLVNSKPLPTYFPLHTHSAAAIQALTLTSSLGSFNVFAIVKGGGIAAQADAVAMGVARALVEWERCEVEAGRIEEATETWRDLLKKAKLIERDPRMVERKKTGQLKARKKFTWVKR
ncbi:ribosomal protein S9/S16-domain-containing protein [Leucosporidium creatinivorum]|uniref:Small ribosomal subunit protein uS9m n=1 Tax=Leucosporidium creatinivorum TaxID=106004 RepID=A0A1Y2FWB3_9BASI|nr:ribosomal protein S9/S16-domain-containing protein [Leucosporidium creatinivorum]